MNQQIAVITLGIENINYSKEFYTKGFCWKPICESLDTIMYQMNGFILSTWLQSDLEEDITRSDLPRGGAITLAHKVDSPNDVEKCIFKLSEHGGQILRNPDAPSHGGIRGYVADPDGHIWEIIYNPLWKIDQNGYVTLSI